MSLSIYLDDQVATIVEATRGRPVPVRSRLVIRFPEDLSWQQDPASAGRWLGDQMRAVGLRAKEKVGVVIPRRYAAFRTAAFPAVGQNELYDLVNLDFEAQEGERTQDLVFDFCPLTSFTDDGMQEVVVASLPNQLVNELELLAKEANLRIGHLTTSDVACLQAFRTLYPEQEFGGIVSSFEDRTEICFSQDACSSLSTTIYNIEGSDAIPPVLGGFRRLLSQSPTALQQLHSVGVAGGEFDADVACEQLAARFQVDTQVIDSEKVGAKESLVDGSFAAAVGGLALQNSQVPCLNFAAPRARAKSTNLVIPLAAVLGVALTVVGGMWWLDQREKLAQLSHRIDELRVTESEARLKIEGQQGTLDRLAELDSWTNSDIVWLDVVNDLQKQVPRDKRIYFTNLMVDSPRSMKPRIRVSGFAKGTKDFTELSSRLLELQPKLRFRPLEVRPNSGDKSYKTRFEFLLEYAPNSEVEA